MLKRTWYKYKGAFQYEDETGYIVMCITHRNVLKPKSDKRYAFIVRNFISLHTYHYDCIKPEFLENFKSYGIEIC